MLTLTAIMVGLMLLGGLVRQLDMKMDKGVNVFLLLVGLGIDAVVVWQFYFVMLPAAWGN